jgi:DNA-binding beta-propeller fold protein YncE
MSMSTRAPLLLLCSLASGCGDDAMGTASATESATTVTTAPPPTGTTMEVPTTSGDATNSGSATDSGTTGGPTPTTGDEGPKLDLGVPDGGFACGCEFNYVWVANTIESTVSKINMETLVEEARYLTRADGMGNPSRTSVSLTGDVAVANRHGGLVKFHADPAKCKDTNGVPGIQTSTGKNDVLAWDMEECRAWYVDFPTSNQRPVAWTQGEVVAGGCTTTNEKVWTVMSETKNLFPGQGGPGGIIVSLVDGETGAIDKQITIPTFSGEGYGAYGAAVNSHGDLFIAPLGFIGQAKIAKVYIDNFAYKVWPVPTEIGPYGITVDHKGRVWLSSNAISMNGAARFDPDAEKWDLVPGFYSGAGIAEGQDDWMWVASGNGATAVHIDTLEIGPVFNSPYYIKGLGTDAKGFLWAVNYALDEEGNQVDPEMVMKIDVDTLTMVDSYDGLNRPYTYSDFTGNALFSVTCMAPG